YKLIGPKAPPPRPKTTLKVTQDDRFIRVNTGPALFEISRKRFNLLDKVILDANGDGNLADDETVVHSEPLLGSVVEDPNGRKYYSSAGTHKVRVIEAGPVMVKVLAQGVHVSDAEGAFKPGLYGYEVSMTFWAGKTFVDVEAILTNNSAKPIGEPHLEDWSILTRIGAGRGKWGFEAAGKRVRAEAGGGALLYQDSVGTEHWRTNTGIKVAGWPKPPAPELATFRGYKLWQSAGDKRVELASGDFADGLALCTAGPAGCAVSARNFWQQFPSALGFSADGVIRVSPFPREYKEVHWIEDGTAKAQEFRLCFFADGARDGREQALAAAKRFQKRVFALPSPAHCGQAGALSDLGPYMVHAKTAQAAKTLLAGQDGAAGAVARRKYGNGYGWQVFGMTWTERAGVSGTNYEPLGSSHNLWSHLLSGRDDFLKWGMRVSRHFRDVRAYHVEARDNLALWTDWNSYTRSCVIEHYSRLVRGPTSRSKRKVWDIYNHPYQRHRWPLPNMQHLNVDEVYDLYCLTGDDRALRCMRTIADHGVVLSTLHPRPRRARRMTGWCLRTLGRYYELTGDKRYKPYL
ncbi:hypothetical protein LCGC14_2305630, partial [marine sediment metagenome]